jgi:3-deoxy-D-manno-octulosonate 8-phosphate phosphatase (KDO 8-P phosphatase)
LPTKNSYRSKLRKIKLLLLDVDGVLTDGGIYYSASGEELKKFNTQDGYGIVKLQRAGIRVGIITGKVSTIVARRATELGIEDVYQNLDDKLSVYGQIKAKLNLEDAHVAYIGDDEFDLPVLERVGFSAAPADAVEAVRRRVHYTCRRSGGAGAVREVIDLLMNSQRKRAGDGK